MRLSWKPSIPDHRDYMFTMSLPSLPDHVDPFDGNNSIEDQGQLGSCTGNSSTTALEIVLKSSALSRLMAYYNGRMLEGTTKSDSGAALRDVIKGFSKYGVCQETLWPYDIKSFAKKPPSVAYKNALSIIPKVKSYERVTSLLQFKTALSLNLPVVFGFSVPDYMLSSQVSSSGWLQYPSRSSKIIGGHAVCGIGFDDRDHNGGFVWVRNSWGSKWGINGDFKMPYQWFQKIDVAGSLVQDCWIIHPAV